MVRVRDDMGGQEDYPLGHSSFELERLDKQARIIEPITRRIFETAGLKPRMRVLDIGCGAGHTSFLAAQMVGRDGQVVGVDSSPVAVETAQRGAGARSHNNISFEIAPINELSFDEPFDALIGRYVLMFQDEPSEFVRACRRHVRPGGLVAFHEVDNAGMRSVPPVDIYDECCRWISSTLERTDMGTKLHDVFVHAGLASPQMRMEALVGGGEMVADCAAIVADLVESLQDKMRELGFDVDTALKDSLSQRICHDAAQAQSVLFGRHEIGAWSRNPSSA